MMTSNIEVCISDQSVWELSIIFGTFLAEQTNSAIPFKICGTSSLTSCVWPYLELSVCLLRVGDSA